MADYLTPTGGYYVVLDRFKTLVVEIDTMSGSFTIDPTYLALANTSITTTDNVYYGINANSYSSTSDIEINYVANSNSSSSLISNQTKVGFRRFDQLSMYIMPSSGAYINAVTISVYNNDAYVTDNLDYGVTLGITEDHLVNQWVFGNDVSPDMYLIYPYVAGSRQLYLPEVSGNIKVEIDFEDQQSTAPTNE